MQGKDTRSEPSERLEVAYTDKPVSGWGGLVAMVRFFDKRGVRELLVRALPDGRTSPNQIPVADMVLSFLITVLTGARRFAHVERLREDETVHGVLGVKRLPSAMSLTRYFGGFVGLAHTSTMLRPHPETWYVVPSASTPSAAAPGFREPCRRVMRSGSAASGVGRWLGGGVPILPRHTSGVFGQQAR
jgi:hypothetical protein